MSADIKKRFGATVSLYLDGHGYESGLDFSCENDGDTARKCPFAMGDLRPMPARMPCTFRQDGTCTYLAAKLDALKKARGIIQRAISETVEAMEW